MDQFSIKELVDAVIGELRRLGYKKSTIHGYEKVCTDLIRYADEQHRTEYTRFESVSALLNGCCMDVFR